MDNTFCSSFNGFVHLNGFNGFHILNNAAMNIDVRVFVGVMFSLLLVYIPRRIAWLYGNHV